MSESTVLPSPGSVSVSDSGEQEGTSDFTAPLGYSSYKGEWEKLFLKADFVHPLKQLGIDGELRSSRFRSVCWKVYLDVLPSDQAQWLSKTREWRQKYESLKQSLVVNPREASEDPALHNPLSQEDENPWNRFFKDNELRLTVKQDVIRTYPDIEFFKENGLRETMMDVLFCYSKTKPQMGYRQGMHELLAPLIFVLHCDHQAFLHACEIEQLGDVLKEILDPQYIEHDAFALFCKIMETAEHWYVSKEMSPTVKSKGVKTKPFARAQDFNPSNVIVNKLTRIQDYLLKKIDPDLYLHLEQLEIPPQVYGIRWLRLLFGREFPMQDLLVVWDAIFADSVGFELVDYIFVAMLLYLREALITSDYPTCLHFLMKYPPVGDINYFIQTAFHLREPSQYQSPPAYTYQKPASLTHSSYGDMFQGMNGLPTTFIATSRTSIATRNTAAVSSSKMAEKASALMSSSFASLTRRLSANAGTGQARSRGSATLPRRPGKASSVPKAAASETSSPVSESAPTSFHSSSQKASTASLSKLEDIPGFNPFRNSSQTHTATDGRRHTHTRAHSVNLEQAVPAAESGGERARAANRTSTKSEDSEQKVAMVLGRMHDMESMCHRCAGKMDLHIDKLQTEMLRNPTGSEDELLLALAGLKQVRDVLKGVLKPASIFDVEEIRIREDHYVHQAESPARVRMQPRADSSDSSPDNPNTCRNTAEKKRSTNRTNSMDTPVTPSAILKHELLAQTEVELSQFNRLDGSVNETDQSSSPIQQSAKK